MITPDKLPTYYNAGTASVVAGQTAITLTGAAWYSAVWGDDLFYLPSQPLVPPQRIAQVNPDGSAVLAYPWPGATANDVAYEVRYVGMIERSTAQSRRVLEQLGDVKSWADVFVATDADRLALESASNPLRAGYRVLVIDTGLIWVKKTGAHIDWLPPAAFKGDQGDPGPYTDISFGPVTTLPAGQPATATEVAIGPGQKRIDLGLPKGADGTGTGDVVGPNGGVADGIIVAFANTGGKVIKAATMVETRLLGRAVGAGTGPIASLAGAEVRGIITLPVAPTALTYLRRAADNLSWEERTLAQIRQDLGGWEAIAVANPNNQLLIPFPNLSAFRTLRLTWGLLPSATSSMGVQVSSDNGATWLAGASDYTHAGYYQLNGTMAAGGGAGASFIEMANGTGTNIIATGFLVLTEFNRPVRTNCRLTSTANNATGRITSDWGVEIAGNTAWNALRVSGGQNLTGQITLEGVRG